MKIYHGLIIFFSLVSSPACRPTQSISAVKQERIITGADQTHLYVPYLKDKRVGMVVNQTSIIGNTLSVDSLLSMNIKVSVVFGPEHGFRGNASNGAKVDDEVDEKTGIQIISLYGKKRKPSKEDLDKIAMKILGIGVDAIKL